MSPRRLILDENALLLFALASSLAFGVPLTLSQPLILGGMGASSLLIVRWIAGVRELPAAA